MAKANSLGHLFCLFIPYDIFTNVISASDIGRMLNANKCNQSIASVLTIVSRYA